MFHTIHQAKREILIDRPLTATQQRHNNRGEMLIIGNLTVFLD